MHIVHVACALKGGPLTVVVELGRHQIAAGHKVSLVYSPLRDPAESFRGDLSPEIELCSIDTPREIDPVGDLRAALNLTRLFRTLRPDIVHLHSSKAGAIGRIAARMAGVPAIYSPHGISYLRTDVAPATRAFYFALEWILGLAGTVTAASSPSELEALRPIPGQKAMIPNAINLGTLQPKDHDEAPTSELQIVLYSRITAQKNPNLACEIAEMSPPSWRWFWLGDGELRDIVRRSGRIEILGWMPHAAALSRLRSADILVHTSTWEGMPMGVLECMALGLPVVATGAIGTRDLILPGVTGFIANDAPTFLSALQTLANSQLLRRRLGGAGRLRVTHDFDPVALAARWANLYAQVRGE
jgi:glycosyltransferase involved in cell wall biosynthesis